MTAPVDGEPDPQARIAALERELAQARAALEDFSYSVSHDLRAPLRHVSAYLKIIREDLGPDLPDDLGGHLKTASDAAAQMGRQMDALLVLSRLGRTELHPVDVDLDRVLADLCRQMEAQFPQRAIEWQLQAPLPAVHADLGLLGQALQHLLDNALRFSAQRSPAVVRVRAARMADGWVELSVQDNGKGFDPRFADRLFKVFQRVHAGPPVDGIGLGLAYVRAVAERHGGTVRAEGAPEQGCTVSLRLPGAIGTQGA